ncbi:hypothetical protein QBC34DRAFT_360781 [Podospora aff. communis PSN243]|uniref:Clr5 domain-containing protein n=1 Tax=Podospora aff. communis PSN243 TaxID=3040156 RepID=A0AAV9G7L9_9PEZI|nr:hypothetical protein QBC34DRAFT_360781 [Podospora aff. communis PSN243]
MQSTVSDRRPGAASLATPSLLSERWTEFAPAIWRLYIIEELPLKDLVREVEKMMNIPVTKAQLEYKLRQSGFRRNLDEKTWKWLDGVIQQRREAGKETTVTLCFRPLDSAKIQKETNRYREWPNRAAETQTCHPAPDLPIAVYTPRPFNPAFKWPASLPWLRFNTEYASQFFSFLMQQRGDGTSGLKFMHKVLRLSGGPVKCIFGLDFQQLAGHFEINMPETYPGEHKYRAGTLTGPSGLNFIHQCLAVIIYEVSNGTIDMQHSWQAWRLVATVLEHSGVLRCQRSIPLPVLECATVSAFRETAVLYAIVTEDRSAQDIMEWLLLSGHDPDSPVFCLPRGYSHTTSLTAVQIASRWGSPPVLQLLLNHGANPNKTASPNILEIAQLLIDHGASIVGDEHIGAQPLLRLALCLGEPDLVERILRESNACDILARYSSEQDEEGMVFESTALTLAAGFFDDHLSDDARNQRAMELVQFTVSKIEPLAPVLDWITTDVFIAAAMEGNYSVIHFLSGVTSAPVHSLNPFGLSPLHAAAKNGCLKTHQVLLDLGCQFDPGRLSNIVRPIHIACAYGHAPVVDLYLQWYPSEKDARLSFKVQSDLGHATGLHREWLHRFHEGVLRRQEAVCYTDLISAILEAGANPNRRDGKGRSDFVAALSTMARSLDRRLCDIAEIFLRHKAKVRGSDLAEILRLKSSALSMLLLDSVQAFPVWSQSGVSVLESAILSGQSCVVEKVMSEYRFEYDPAPLCASLLIPGGGAWEMAQRLLSNRPALCNTNDSIMAQQLEGTAIGIAAGRFSTEPELLRLLLSTLPCQQVCILPGYPQWPRDYAQNYICTHSPFWESEFAVTGSPLVLAAWTQSVEPFVILLDHGYKPDCRTWRALGYRNLTSRARILRDRGFRCRVENSPVWQSEARNTINAAIRLGNLELVSLLLDAGLPLNYDPKDIEYCRTPLQMAVEKGRLSIAHFLLRAGAEVNTPSAWVGGATALQLAAIKGYLGIANLLLEPDRYANVNAPRARREGRTALEGAAEHGRIDMIELFLQHGVHTTGTGRRQFIRSIKFAEREGHLVAAKLLRSHRELTDEDEELLRSPELLAEEGWWSDEWGDDCVQPDWGDAELDLKPIPAIGCESYFRAEHHHHDVPGSTASDDDLLDEFIDWESESSASSRYEESPFLGESSARGDGDETREEADLVLLRPPGLSNMALCDGSENQVLKLGIDPMWGEWE